MNAPAVKNEATAPAKIYAAMATVQKSVGAVGKNRQNSQQNYKFRGIDDIYLAVQGVMAEAGVFSLPEVIEQRREERKTRDGKGALVYTILTVRHTFYAADGSSVQAVTVGEAMDSGDKSANKAMSAAEKYALIQAFKIPTEEARDSETDSPQVAARQANGFEQVVRGKLRDRGLKGREIEEAVRGIADSYELSSLDELPGEQRSRVLRGIVAGQADRWMSSPARVA